MDAPWNLELKMQCNLPFPEVGAELKPAVAVHYNGTNVNPPNFKVLFTSPVRPLNLSPRILIPTPSGLKRLIKPRYAKDHSDFRILSYNLLADVYVKTGRDQYDHCPSYQLSWDYRRQNLLAEMLSYEADILCLQEVQSDHFYNFFEPEFARFGYSAVYKGKMKALCYGKECHVTDGCATFFRSNKFKLVKSYEVECEKMAKSMINKLSFESINQRNDAVSRLVKDNIATVLILEEAGDSHSRICVANTHLQGGKGMSDVRLFQIISLIEGLQKIDSLGIPVLVCGDMNSPREVTPMSLSQKVDGVLEFPYYESVGKKRQLPTPQWSSDHVSLVADLRIRKAYRKENYSDLPTDPWEEASKVELKVKVKNNLEARKQQTFKKLKKPNHVKFGPKNTSILDRLIMESLVNPCASINLNVKWVGNRINHHLKCSQIYV